MNGRRRKDADRSSISATVFLMVVGWFLDPGRTEAVQFFHEDHLGSPVVITNDSGEVTQQSVYSPLGEPLGEIRLGGSETLQRLYTGQEWDRESDFYDYGVRTYDPVLGRFQSTDPARDGQNLYAYARQNPLRYVDPDGRKAIFADKKAQQILARNAPYIPDPIMNIVLDEDVVFRTIELKIPLEGGTINLGEAISGGFIPAEVGAEAVEEARRQKWSKRFDKVPILGKIPEGLFRLWFKVAPASANPEIQVTPNITWDYLLHQISHIRLGDRYGEMGPFSLQLHFLAGYFVLGKVAYEKGCQEDPVCTRGWEEDMGTVLGGMRQMYETLGPEEFFGRETPQVVREKLEPFLKTGDREKARESTFLAVQFGGFLLDTQIERER